MRSLVLFLLCMIILAGQIYAVPKIEISDPNYNFGKIVQHAVLTKRFFIRNTGSTAAKVIEVKPDCGCVDAILLDSVIKVKDSVPLDIVFHTRNFLGFMEKKPAIKIEGSSETYVMTMHAEIIVKPENASPLIVTPAKVDVSQFSTLPRRRGVFTISNNSVQDYQIRVIDSSFKSFTVDIPAVIKAGAKIEGKVIVHKDDIMKSFEESFTFIIDDNNHSRYSVPISRTYLVKDSTSK